MPLAPTEIRSLARQYTKQAIRTLAHVMREPKAPPVARVMAANSLLDRGWGKAAQLVDVQGEIRQLVEVKLNVVQAAPARTIDAAVESYRHLPDERVFEIEANNIKDLADETLSLPNCGSGESK
jgi:hypothetical protein